jgi:hypothetical protein
MWFRNLFDSLAATPSRTPTGRARRVASRRRPAAARLQLEALEDRCLLSFLPVVNYPVGVNPQAVVTGDFNGDGKLDLAVANTNSNTVSILLGKGDGTFQPAQNFATGAGPRSLAVGDFNNDGKLDIVTANYGTVSVLLGNGDGTFQPARTFGIGSNPQSVAVGDFNGDGKLDLAVASIDWPASYSTGSIYENVLLGNGDGSFGTPNVMPLNSYPSSAAVAVADFNGDGKLDFATAEGTWFQSDVAVSLGTGTGTFSASSYFTVGDSPRSVAVGDVNGDGKLDLVTANGGDVSVLLGNGTGSFAAAQNYAAGSGSFNSVALADFNGDGKLDIVVTNAGGVSVLLGLGEGTFSPPVSAPAGSSPVGVAVGDFNGDGRPDLAVANYGSNNISLLINDGSWPIPTPPTPQVTSLVVSGFPSSTTAGTAGSFTITAKYANGTTATNYTGAVHFTSSDPLAVLPANYTFTAAEAGVHAFSATLKTAGTTAAGSITVTDTARASLIGTQSGITVNPAAASKLDVFFPDGGPGGIAGNSFSFTLTAYDPYNNIATGYTGTVHFTSTDGQAILPGDYTFTAADAGGHTFSAILKTAGSQTVTATDTVSGSITSSFTGPVSPAAASSMIVAGFPSPTTAGVAGTFTVTLKDPYDNIASGYSGTVRVTSSDGKASLPANYTFTAADAGVHTFSATLKTTGTQSITAKDTVTVALTGTDGGITVKPGAASRFILSAPASVSAGVPFSLTITVQDAYGNVVTGYTGTIHFTSTDNTATLPADYTFTVADKGVHTFTGLVLRKRGTQKITITDTLSISLTGSVIENVL